MTPSLRRAHRTIWLLLAITLPVGFVTALRASQSPPEQEPITQSPSAPLPILVRSTTTNGIEVNLRQVAQGPEKQLEVVVKHPFEAPSAVVLVRQNGNWRAVGLLNATGVYRFPLPTADDHPQVEIKDDVHGQMILTVEF